MKQSPNHHYTNIAAPVSQPDNSGVKNNGRENEHG